MSDASPAGRSGPGFIAGALLGLALSAAALVALSLSTPVEEAEVAAASPAGVEETPAVVIEREPEIEAAPQTEAETETEGRPEPAPSEAAPSEGSPFEAAPEAALETPPPPATDAPEAAPAAPVVETPEAEGDRDAAVLLRPEAEPARESPVEAEPAPLPAAPEAAPEAALAEAAPDGLEPAAGDPLPPEEVEAPVVVEAEAPQSDPEAAAAPEAWVEIEPVEAARGTDGGDEGSAAELDVEAARIAPSESGIDAAQASGATLFPDADVAAVRPEAAEAAVTADAAWRAYSAPFTAPEDAPLVGLLVSGLEGPGALADLPDAPLTVAVDPESRAAARLAEAAREAGLELVVEAGAAARAGDEALAAALELAPEATGMTLDGAADSVSASAEALSVAIRRGMMAVLPPAPGGEIAAGLLTETRVPETRPAFVVAADADAELAFQILREAARRAEAEGAVVVRLEASPATLSALARWRAVEDRARPAPLTAILQRRGGARN